MSENKIRIRRTKEQIIESLDSKIAYHNDCIKKLETKKEAVLNPKPRKKKPSMKDATAIMETKGLTVEDLIEMLESVESK